MRPIKEWYHAYVGLHVDFWEDDAGFNCPVRVPKWYGKLWGYPNGTWIRRYDVLDREVRYRYGSSGYHIGHWTAVLSVVVPVVYLIF